jgi:hypothetical protein
MTDLALAIQKKEAEIARLTEELQTLRRAAAILEEGDIPISGGTITVRDGKALTQSLMTREVLEEAETPLHIAEIIKRVQVKYGRVLQAPSLQAILYKYAQRGAHFYKVEGVPNTYGLLSRRAPHMRKKDSAPQEIEL